jgi:hypothetical protein
MSAVAGNNEKRQATGWFRGVLTAILDVAPLPDWAKQKTASVLRRLPDWYIARWAGTLNIDYLVGYKAYPDLAKKAETDTARSIILQYLAAHRAMAAASSLRRLTRTVLRLYRQGRLPADKEVVEQQVCALAWADCTPEGMKFAENARAILSRDEPGNHILDDYRIALEHFETDRLQRLDNILTSIPYGRWVTERLDEAKRWLGLDEPTVHIHHGPRTPFWELLWQDLFTGGADDKRN